MITKAYAYQYRVLCNTFSIILKAHMDTISRIKDILGSIIFSGQKKLSFIIFGYTDLMLSKKQWLEHVNEETYLKLDNRQNHESLKKIHGRADVEKVPTWKCIENLIFENNIQFTFIDFDKYEGSELLLDLNFRVPETYFEKYDAVLDLGTSEHIFNYPQVLMNCHLLAKKNGIIYHEVPLNWPNHGFYGLSPTLFYNFYTDNKASTLECSGIAFERSQSDFRIIRINDIPVWERFNLNSISGREIEICYKVRKEESVIEFSYPIQQKYRSTDKWR